MRKYSLILVICVGLLFCFNFNLLAQTPDELIEDVVSKFSTKEDINTFLKGYAKPMATGLGTGMTGGLSHNAAVHGILGFDVGIKTVFVPISDDEKKFDFNGTVEQATGTATLIGSSGATGSLGTTYSKGLDLSLIPVPLIQASKGLPGGLEVMVRGIGAISYKGNDITFFGAGIKNELGTVLPLPLVMPHLSVQAAYHKMTFGNFFDLSTFSANLQVGKGIPLVMDFYAGVGFDIVSAEVTYTFNDKEESVDIDADDGLKLMGGVVLKPFPFIQFPVEYNLSFNGYNSIVLGIIVDFL